MLLPARPAHSDRSAVVVGCFYYPRRKRKLLAKGNRPSKQSVLCGVMALEDLLRPVGTEGGHVWFQPQERG